MVSDSELVERLREFLRTSDLNTTTTAIVRRKLEEDFGIDLSEKKAFIREQVDLFLQTQIEKNEAEEAVEEEEEDEEEKEVAICESPIVKSEDEEGSDEEEEEEQEEETSNGRRRKKKVSNKSNKEVKKRGGGGGFTKVCSLSPQLQKFVGVPELARTEVVKQLWAYIREKDLQDPKNRRNILCDESLRELFRVDTINMFQMNKALSKHIWPLESEEAPVKSDPKEKQRKQERTEDPDEPKPKEKRQKSQKGGGSGFLAPLLLSDALVKFFGTGETSLSRAEVVKKMWDYIKQNNLQDPSDKRRVICDDKLKELFDVDTFNGFTVSKLLTVHFVKSEQV